MTAYYTLIVSLPRHDRQFTVSETPISHPQLEKRLALLSVPDRKTTQEVIMFVWSSRFLGDIPLATSLLDARHLLKLNNSFINGLIQWHLDLRSLMAALRWRKASQIPPANPEAYWHSRFNTHILNHWNEPDFGIKRFLPWFSALAEKLDKGEAEAVENIILDAFWKYLTLAETQHYFDLEAVIIYLMRWHVVDYWSQFNGEKALERMNALAMESMNDHPVCSDFYKAIPHEY